MGVKAERENKAAKQDTTKHETMAFTLRARRQTSRPHVAQESEGEKGQK